jgi:acetyl-CoA acetyltransferase
VIEARKASRKPLGLYDFAPISDGASALILTSAEKAQKITSKPVYVLGAASATDYLNYPAREDLTSFVATQIAMENALKMSKVNLFDIQVLELNDQSTMMEMVSLEDLGFCERGTAWKCMLESYPEYKGYLEVKGKKLFINLNGGLKADGNPLGATGGAQLFEIVKQLKGEAGPRQAASDSSLLYGCSNELEGFGTKSYITILGKNT